MSVTEEPTQQASSSSAAAPAPTGQAVSPALAKLEPFLLLAKSARGAAAAKLVLEATAAPGCYVFAELSDTAGVRALSEDKDHSATVRLLQLFSFGTLADYIASPQSFPRLAQVHIDKLRQLTLVSLASRSRVLPYSQLLEALQLGAYVSEDGSLISSSASQSSSRASGRPATLDPSTVRHLEDLLIECTYAGLISGKIDHKREVYHVDSVIGRDVNGEDEIKRMEVQLREWNDTTLAVLAHLQDRIQGAKDAAHREAQLRKQHDDSLAQVLHAVHSENVGGKGGPGSGGGPGSNWQGMGMDLDEQGFGQGAMSTRSASKKKVKRTKT